MSYLLYLVGLVVFVAGMGWLATAMGVSQTYILVGAALVFGAGIFTAVARTRMRD